MKENREMKYKNCYDLQKLPWFGLNENGKLALVADDLPPIVDFHTHLALTLKIAPKVDLQKHTPNVKHNFREKSVKIDMSLYSGVNLKNERRKGMFKEYLSGAVSNKGAVATYTTPNILSEMDRMGIEKSVLLAIDPPRSWHVTKSYLDNSDGKRTIPFAGLNPRDREWEKHMDECVAMGAKGLKVHPYLQFFPPNDKRVINLMKRWSKTGLPIIFHTANNGLEPAFLRKLSDIGLYREALRALPNATFILGHAGMGFYRDAVEMAKEHGNTYLEIGGQPPDVIREIVDTLGEDKVLFGSDWPVYPFALPLAKLLIATEDAPDVRRKILADNANYILSGLKSA